MLHIQNGKTKRKKQTFAWFRARPSDTMHMKWNEVARTRTAVHTFIVTVSKINLRSSATQRVSLCYLQSASDSLLHESWTCLALWNQCRPLESRLSSPKLTSMTNVKMPQCIAVTYSAEFAVVGTFVMIKEASSATAACFCSSAIVTLLSLLAFVSCNRAAEVDNNLWFIDNLVLEDDNWEMPFRADADIVWDGGNLWRRQRNDPACFVGAHKHFFLQGTESLRFEASVGRASAGGTVILSFTGEIDELLAELCTDCPQESRFLDFKGKSKQVGSILSMELLCNMERASMEHSAAVRDSGIPIVATRRSGVQGGNRASFPQYRNRLEESANEHHDS